MVFDSRLLPLNLDHTCTTYSVSRTFIYHLVENSAKFEFIATEQCWKTDILWCHKDNCMFIVQLCTNVIRNMSNGFSKFVK